MYLLFSKPQEYLAQESNLCHSDLEREKGVYLGEVKYTGSQKAEGCIP